MWRIKVPQNIHSVENGAAECRAAKESVTGLEHANFNHNKSVIPPQGPRQKFGMDVVMSCQNMTFSTNELSRSGG
jgi:hypothetical protein